MATTMYFEEIILDQGGKDKMFVELGRSSYYAGAKLKDGVGEDSIYLTVDDKTVIMNREMAKKFVEAVYNVGCYHRLID